MGRRFVSRYLGGVLLIIGLVAMHHLAVTACHHGDLQGGGVHAVEGIVHSGGSATSQVAPVAVSAGVVDHPGTVSEGGPSAVVVALVPSHMPDVPAGLVGSLCLAVLLLLLCLRPLSPADRRPPLPAAHQRLHGRIPEAPDLSRLVVSRT